MINEIEGALYMSYKFNEENVVKWLENLVTIQSHSSYNTCLYNVTDDRDGRITGCMQKKL